MMSRRAFSLYVSPKKLDGQQQTRHFQSEKNLVPQTHFRPRLDPREEGLSGYPAISEASFR